MLAELQFLYFYIPETTINAQMEDQALLTLL